MNKPTRHEWEEGSTHRSVAGKEYDEVWDYVAQLEAENSALKRECENWKGLYEIVAANLLAEQEGE